MLPCPVPRSAHAPLPVSGVPGSRCRSGPFSLIPVLVMRSEVFTFGADLAEHAEDVSLLTG